MIINNTMKKVIKGTVVTCQTAQFVSLMPKPKDFVQKIVQDVVYLSKRVQRLSNDINTLLDSYADIPSEYILSTMNNITSTATGLVNKATSYVTNPLDTASNSLNMVSSLTGTAIDAVNVTSTAVNEISSVVGQTSTTILGQANVAKKIKNSSSAILEWTNNGFKNLKSDVTSPITDALSEINNEKNKITSKANAVNDLISSPQRWIENLLSNLKEKMDNLSSTLDTGFGDVTGVTSISKGASYVTDLLNDAGSTNELTTATTAVSQSIENVLKNFSISKVVLAFGGVAVSTALVKTGLDSLPAIDYISMLNKVKGKNKETNNDLYYKYNALISDTENNVLIPNDERDYDSSQYKKFIKEFNDDIAKQRAEIRLAMKNHTVEGKLNQVEVMKMRKELKSAIKEIKKFRKKAKGAKQTVKLIDEINIELSRFRQDVNKRSKKIKNEWNDMMTQYKTAIKKMTTFFKSGGPCSLYIDDCCDAINKDGDDIKELCSNLTLQLSMSTLKASVTSDIGLVSPNAVYKFADLIVDIKIIFNFIKDLIKYILDIIKNANNIARLMVNGINKLDEVLKNLLSLLGIQWLIDLIQSILDLFEESLQNSGALIENIVSPVYYEDTDEYTNTLDTLEKIYSDSSGNITNEQYDILSNSNRFYSIDIEALKKAVKKNDTDKLDDILDDIDKKAEELVAYRSPIVENEYKNVTVSEMMENTSVLPSTIKFKGWIYYHPNLRYKGSTYYTSHDIFTRIIRKIKEKIIKKAAKTGNRKSGGVSMLKRKHVEKATAYKAFYWYTYYTPDIEDSYFEQSTEQDTIKIGSTISTENGTIVELTDGRKVFVNDVGIRSGDYVTVEGVKYRVK